jgi:deazaflavin-dependent oxidoreductase (nitroreductase family)
LAGWQWFGKLHISVYRATRGRIGGNLIGMPVLLLTTTGRRSGVPRTSPLPFLRDDERYVIVGSNSGGPRDPAWWLNLRADPRCRVQVMGEELSLRAHLAQGEERARLWPALQKFNRADVTYERKTEREIPVVVLTPETSDDRDREPGSASLP